MKIINLTPHPVDIIRDGRHLVIPDSGIIARCVSKRKLSGRVEVDDAIIPVYRLKLGEVENLPGPVAGTLYVVSLVVAMACSGREDLLVVDEPVRDAEGRISGARAFARVMKK